MPRYTGRFPATVVGPALVLGASLGCQTHDAATKVAGRAGENQTTPVTGPGLEATTTREPSLPAAEPHGKPASAWPKQAPSCAELASSCGADATQGCCRSLLVSGGTFARSYDAVDYLDASYEATLSDFYLDQYEVTVGRFRAFVRAGGGTQAQPPERGSGAHPKVQGSGWRSEYNVRLAEDTQSLEAALKCFVHHSWTDSPGDSETLPINCLDWYTAFAFCEWDAGRLPSEAEWNYAASGGSEHRYYPWSQPPASTLIDDTYAVYCGGSCRLLNVGSKSPKGDGKWGQSDLGGNAWEWTLDYDSGRYPVPCSDCAVVASGTYRAFRSGSNDELAPTLRSATRHVYYPNYRGNIGVRCARSP